MSLYYIYRPLSRVFFSIFCIFSGLIVVVVSPLAIRVYVAGGRGHVPKSLRHKGLRCIKKRGNDPKAVPPLFTQHERFTILRKKILVQALATPPPEFNACVYVIVRSTSSDFYSAATHFEIDIERICPLSSWTVIPRPPAPVKLLSLMPFTVRRTLRFPPEGYKKDTLRSLRLLYKSFNIVNKPFNLGETQLLNTF